jgi:cell division protein FtsW (lipid II flippase)
MVQPSQFAITAGIMVLERRLWGVADASFPLFAGRGCASWPQVLAAVPAALVIKEDLGSGLVWGPVFLAIMLVGSIPFRYLIVKMLLVPHRGTARVCLCSEALSAEAYRDDVVTWPAVRWTR